MVDTQLFWYKIKEWLAKMADGASDYVYTDESKKHVDIINLFLLGWILFGLVVYILGNVIATQLKKRKAGKCVGPAPAGPEEHLCAEEPVVSVKVPLSTEAGLSSKVESSNETLPSAPLLAPLCSGEDTDVVDWINNVFTWIYTHRLVSPVLNPWLSALNARTRLASEEHGVFVDFQSVVPVNEPPVITEAFESINSSNEINVTCHVELLKLAFDVLVTQIKENNKSVHKFKLNLARLAGMLTTDCDYEKLTSVSRFSERPQVELEIEPVVENSLPPEDYELLHNVVCEIASDAFSTSVVQHDFASYPECPKYKKSRDATSLDAADLVQKKHKERLLVKIVKATNLGTSQGTVTKPYCVIEMDEPPQRFETTPVEDAACPFWDESFIFVLKDTSAELLFEIYDMNRPENENFLGLCIVSVDELVQNPSQRQIIPLHARPLEKDNVSGTLTAEFLFMDREIPTPEVTQLGQPQAKSNGIGKVIETNSRVTAGGTIITTTTIKRTTEDAEEITETALKELEKPGKPGSTNKSMLIIHSVQRELIQPNMKVKLDKSGKWQEVLEPGNIDSDSLEASPITHPSLDSQSSYTESIPSSPSRLRNGVDRSRPKEKKSLIGNLRKKLSFRKPRSRSMEAQERLNASPVPGAGSNRSVSSDRMKVPPGARDSSSLRSGRNRLAVLGSSRSSFSEASGLSTASSRTYINENSTLVIEINENGIIKRYLIPTSMIHRSKWKKKGTKLHLYNDHVFIAKHFSKTALCQVCKKFLTRRPGKQGYECRDCNLQCHKSCHVKVPEYCPNSSVTAMEVEYISDPRLTKPKAV